MEGLTRLVVESMSRHGFDRPLDYRRLQWSRWFRCESPHSLLLIPSKPGLVALAEEIVPGPDDSQAHTITAGSDSQERSWENRGSEDNAAVGQGREGHDFGSEPALSKRSAPKGAEIAAPAAALAAEVIHRKRMLAVLRFYEAEDMAFVLDRMFAPTHPMRPRLAQGHCFVRFVVIDDAAQRSTICSALNQWMIASADKISGTTGDFTSSLELAPSLPTSAPPTRAVQLDSGSAANMHCPSPLPSGF
jgi:hypothetical protein